MRYIATVLFLSLFCLVSCKNNVKTLTDNLGSQEVIEIVGPKELPPGLDEEPGADSDEDVSLTTTPAPIKKDFNKKTTTLAASRRNMKDIDKIDGKGPENEEVKLEKELAEIYKDNDYKDITEETVVTTKPTTTTAVTEVTEEIEKAIVRSNEGFKFAPDSTSRHDIDKFRTSVDDISCKSRQKLSVTSSALKQNIAGSAVTRSPVIIVTQIVLAIGTALCL